MENDETTVNISEYRKYQLYLIRELKEVPFLYKYLTLDILQRLKKIDYFCGMSYASKDIYNFDCNVSRYDHSVNTALLTWKYTHDKEATIAALFHDISTPVFSHVIDYMNRDYKNQESTEAKTFSVMASSEMLSRYLEIDGISLAKIANFKDYSIVDIKRPGLCADRLDGIITSSLVWSKNANFSGVMAVIDSIDVANNEKKQLELNFMREDTASYLQSLNDTMNEMTHSKEDTYMMCLLASIVKHLINRKVVIYDDLFVLNEENFIMIIEQECLEDHKLRQLWDEFKNKKSVDKYLDIEVKNRKLVPLVWGERLK